jgi:hypothetical protein
MFGILKGDILVIIPLQQCSDLLENVHGICSLQSMSVCVNRHFCISHMLWLAHHRLTGAVSARGPCLHRAFALVARKEGASPRLAGAHAIILPIAWKARVNSRRTILAS